MLRLVRLHTSKRFFYSPLANARYALEKELFIRTNHRDISYEFSITEDIPYQAEYCLVHNPERGPRPWFTNPCLLFLLDLITLGWVQRLFLTNQTNVVEYGLNKYIID